MLKPSAYPDHNESLNKWVAQFSIAKPLDITAKSYETEQFIHDGIINLWGVIIKFDWEKRQDWNGENFPFQEVGQFERKFSKEKEIELAIMCNLEETHFLVAWHSDFQDKVAVLRKTDSPSVKEQGFMRLSSKYKIFSYQKIEVFKMWLLNTYPLRLGRINLKR
jgi:hypothetical protein